MTGTAAVFGAAGNAEEENISLETLSKDAVEKIMTAYKAGRDVADHYYTATVEPALIRRYNVYRADTDHYRKKFKTLSEYSDWVSRDVKTTIDWIMPSLMEVFTEAEAYDETRFPATSREKRRLRYTEEGRGTMSRVVEEIRAESKAEGRLEGRAEGRAETLDKLVRDGLVDVRAAAASLGLDPEEVERMLA